MKLKQAKRKISTGLLNKQTQKLQLLVVNLSYKKFDTHIDKIVPSRMAATFLCQVLNVLIIFKRKNIHCFWKLFGGT